MKGQMSPQKRELIRAVVVNFREGQGWSEKRYLAKLRGTRISAVSRTAATLVDAGYLHSLKDGNGGVIYRPTEQGLAYYDKYLADGGHRPRGGRGRPSKLTANDIREAKRLLVTKGPDGRKHTLDQVAEKLEIGRSALWWAMHPEQNAARNAKRRKAAQRKEGS
jgi:hypothetical protein